MSTSTSTASTVFPQDEGGERLEPLIRVQDIGQLLVLGQPLPPHIQYLLTLKGDQDFVSVHELAARLCHALMIETGFFPVCDDLDNLSPTAAMDMLDKVRIPQFARKLTVKNVFADQGVYTIKYKVILGELQDVPDADVGNKKAGGGGSDMDMEVGEVEHEGDSTEQHWNYRFSEDINVTMIIMGDRLSITAFCNRKNDQRPLAHQFTLNIEEFFNQQAKMVPVKLRPDQWLRKFDINFTRLSVFFKNKFCIAIVDQLDGVLFERRGLFSLPELVLFKIFKMSDVRTIISMSETCTYFYNVAKDHRMWKYLFERDFPNEPAILEHIPAPASSLLLGQGPPAPPSTQANTEPSSPPGKEGSGSEPDYYEIYKQKYATKHRRIRQVQSFPLRLFPTFRIGRRMPSIPFHFDRFV